MLLRSIQIRRFRGFKDLKLDGFERINLIAGMNNVGKTTLIEAIFLMMGPQNPGLNRVLDAWRGRPFSRIDAVELWGDLFYDYRTSDEIEISSVDDSRCERSLTFRLEPRRSSRIVTGEGTGADAAGTASDWISTRAIPRELKLRYRDSDGNTCSAGAYIEGNEIRQESDPFEPFAPAIFLPTTARYPQEDAERFSDLKARGLEKSVLESMRLLEPRLKELAVLVEGGRSTLHGDVGMSRMAPVSLMGEGMNRLLSIVLAIAAAAGGVVLIDEIEAGLHYSVMPQVWKGLMQAARDAEVQLFATTHSWDGIRTAHEVFSEDAAYDFRLYRLDRIGEEIRVVSFDRELMSAVMKTDLEIR